MAKSKLVGWLLRFAQSSTLATLGNYAHRAASGNSFDKMPHLGQGAIKNKSFHIPPIDHGLLHTSASLGGLPTHIVVATNRILLMQHVTNRDKGLWTERSFQKQFGFQAKKVHHWVSQSVRVQSIVVLARVSPHSSMAAILPEPSSWRSIPSMQRRPSWPSYKRPCEAWQRRPRRCIVTMPTPLPLFATFASTLSAVCLVRQASGRAFVVTYGVLM